MTNTWKIWKGEKAWAHLGKGAGVPAPTSAKTMLKAAKIFVRGEWKLDNDKLVVLADAAAGKPDHAYLLLPGDGIDLDDAALVCHGMAQSLKKLRARRFALVITAWMTEKGMRVAKYPNAIKAVCILVADTNGGRAAGSFTVKRTKGKERLGRWQNWEPDPSGTCVDDMVVTMLATAHSHSEAVH